MISPVEFVPTGPWPPFSTHPPHPRDTFHSFLSNYGWGSGGECARGLNEGRWNCCVTRALFSFQLGAAVKKQFKRILDCSRASVLRPTQEVCKEGGSAFVALGLQSVQREKRPALRCQGAVGKVWNSSPSGAPVTQRERTARWSQGWPRRYGISLPFRAALGLISPFA